LAEKAGMGIVWENPGAPRAFQRRIPKMKKTSRRPLSIVIAAWFAGLTVVVGGAPAQGAPLKSDSVVKATVVAEKPGADGKQVVTVTLAIDKGWHLYANPVGAEEFATVQTTVKVKAKAALDNVTVAYPPGKEIKDPTLGAYKVYEDKATITITANRAKGDDSPLELTVKVQACNEKTCLLPAEVKLTAAP
jgi:thiol:disulfide interchange protein